VKSSKHEGKLMDERCPRKLDEQPDTWCPLAVMRLKALRNAGRELTEDEESKLPGCPWAVNHQLANYCFFNYVSQFLDENNPPSESEIAHFNNLSQDTVKKTVKRAMLKIRDSEDFRELIESHGGENILEDSSDTSSYNITK
jgi:hypothetical protein